MPRSRAAGDPSLPGTPCCQVQTEQLHAIPTAATSAGPRQPEQLFVFWAGRRLGSLPTPNNYSVWQPDQAGQKPKSEQWLVSAGLVVARSPMNQAPNPIPRLWANPSPRARGTPASKSAILWALHYHALSPMGRYGSLWLFSCVSGQLFEIPVVFPVFAPLSCYLLVHVTHEPYLQAVQ